MALTFRQTDILGIARDEGKVQVEDLARRFDVTVQTIRRDLSELAEGGQLERVHGGAVLRSGVANIAYEERRALMAAEKAAIGRACAADIKPGSSVFLNIGTTTEAVARALLGHRDLMVVTNNINIAQILAASPDCEIHLVGGIFRRSDGGLVGAKAAEMAAEYRVDIAVIGCSALDPGGDLLDFDVGEVVVSRTVIARARRKVLVADHSKAVRSAPLRIAGIADLDAIYMDKDPGIALSREAARAGVDMKLCGEGGPEP